MIDSRVFQSSMIQSGSYDSDKQILEVTFVNGDTYIAEQVPPIVWQGLKRATSPGRYFHQSLKPLYGFTKS